MDVQDRLRLLAEDMSAKLRVKGEGLADIAERAGRKLPRRLRDDVRFLIDAETMAAHPKLSRLLDNRRVARAEKRLRRYLGKLDPAAERRGEILDLLAKIAFVFVTIVLALFFFLIWRGYIG